MNWRSAILERAGFGEGGGFQGRSRWPNPFWILSALLTVVLILGIAGATYIAMEHPGGSWKLIDLDEENTIASGFSALILLGASVIGLIVYRRRILGIRFGWLILAALFLFMAADEYVGIHEKLEGNSSFDWQLIYVPVFLVCGVTWLLVVRAMRRGPRSALLLMLAGGVCWVVAQALERLQWNGDVPVPGYGFMMVPEEMLEMAGSIGFLVSLYTLAWVDRASGDHHEAPMGVESPSRAW